MKSVKRFLPMALLPLIAGVSYGTNGDNIISVGPISRGMGGLSIAYPQDPISSVFANPAAMCFGPYCPMSEVNTSLTAFLPQVSAKVSNPFDPSQTIEAKSNDPVYPIPAIGFSRPLNIGEQDRWRFGLSAYGVSGMGVDYLHSSLNSTLGDFAPMPEPFASAPIATGTETLLQIMKIAPAIAYKASPDLSIGASVHYNYSELEMGEGPSSGDTIGYQLGLLYHPHKHIYTGLSYTSSQEIKYNDVLTDFTGKVGDLRLEAPQQIGGGFSFELMEKRLVFGAEAKWINWSDASGYKEFGWKDQWSYSIGAQYQLKPEKWTMRVGYNYGNNPVIENHGWDGSFNPMTMMPNEMVNVQGNMFPRYYYETFRIIGFPAIVEHHLTTGLSYQVNEKFSINFAYLKALEETITETGTGLFGAPTIIESSLYEDSFEIGASWRY